MKRKLLLILTICCIICTLAACGNSSKVTSAYYNEKGALIVKYDDGSEQELDSSKVDSKNNKNKTVVSTDVNDEKHLIVKYSDGSQDDLGYVGIEVEPPMFTVTFVDKNGNVLSTETLYRGRSATAPAAPNVTDMVFDGWDVDFSNVQSDLTVRPKYVAMAEYTVTFVDMNGKTIKTQQVIHGKSATAPAAPSVPGKIFDKWDTDYSRITKDTTVQAVYRNPGNFVVTFNDYSGRKLSSVDVVEGATATAPSVPEREGYNFTGWSSSINNITSSKTVTAQYSLKSGNNIVDASYMISGNTLKVTYTIKGTVKFAGCDVSVTTPSGLTFVSLDAGSGVVANQSGGTVYFNVAGANDITSETKLGTVTYTIGSVSQVTLGISVDSITTASGNDASYSIIGKKVTIK